MKLYSDPKGEAYKQIIDLAIQNSACFVLGEKMPVFVNKSSCPYANVLKALEPYLIQKIIVPDNRTDQVEQLNQTYRSHAFYTTGTYYLYKCCEESGDVLKEMANRLSDWIFPNMPEDLCFLKEGGGDYLYSVVHEKMYGMGISEEEAMELMERITGVFFQLKAHKDFDCLLDDAIKHKTERLYISGHRLAELPDRIQELTELRELEIFEQDLCRLPEGLFKLNKLERLKIYSADLERIPSSIGKLSYLKELGIYCGSSDRPNFKVKPKEEISLNCIPPEIGELQQLEQLTIQYSSIQELPQELEKLKNLRVLDISPSMISETPRFLERMTSLSLLDVSSASLFERLNGKSR